MNTYQGQFQQQSQLQGQNQMQNKQGADKQAQILQM